MGYESVRGDLAPALSGVTTLSSSVAAASPGRSATASPAPAPAPAPAPPLERAVALDGAPAAVQTAPIAETPRALRVPTVTVAVGRNAASSELSDMIEPVPLPLPPAMAPV